MSDVEQRCDYCGGPVAQRRRGGSRAGEGSYCSKAHRQAAHRMAKGRPRSVEMDVTPRRFAYADPPYPKMSRRYYRDHPDYAGEVDHGDLITRLVDEYPDGWALSTSARSIKMVLDLCPRDVRLHPWFRGPRRTRARYPLYACEFLIVSGGRPWPSDRVGERVDSLITDDDEVGLVYTARARRSDPNHVTGAKPATFIWWMFDMLGALPVDSLDDLFPGSGGVGRVWDVFTAAQHDASHPPATARRIGEQLGDASHSARAARVDVPRGTTRRDDQVVDA